MELQTITPVVIPSIQQMGDEQLKYLSVQECAKALGVSAQTIARAIKEKRLKAYKVGRLLRIRQDDFVAFVEGKPQIKEGKSGKKK